MTWRGPAGRRNACAVAASLALHACLLGWWSRWASPPLAPVARVEPVAIEVDVAAAPTVEGASRPEASLPPPSSTLARPTHRRAGSGSAAASGGDRGARAVSDGGGLLRMRTGPPPVDVATLGRFEREGIIAPTVAPTAAQSARRHGFSERMAARAREDKARINVFDGRVHPLLYDYARDAERTFRPAEGQLYADPRSPNTIGRALRSWASDLLTADSRYLMWQRALAAKRAAARGATAEQADVLRKYDQMVHENAEGARPMACLVCVVISPGSPPKVELRSSSGNGELDRAAIEALTRATLRRPLDPEVKPERACYHFSATIRRVPPLPVAGCGFDETTRTFSCYYPTMKVLRTKVVLETVDYDG